MLLFFTTIVPAAFAGVAWGILGGALPGISPSITMALLLPLTYGAGSDRRRSCMLASTYVGAEYGGSIPAILIRTPGTNAAAATVIDGYAMKQQGKAGEALGISLYSGFVGGLFGLVVLVLLAEPLSTVALAFTPHAYFALGVLGLSVIASLSRESLVKGLMAGVARPDDLDDRHRSGDRPEPLHVRQPGAAVGHPADPGDGRPVRHRRAARAERRARMAEAAEERARIHFPSPAMWRRIARPQAIGSVIGTVRRHACRAAAARSRRSSPTTRRGAGRATRRSSATARRKALPRPRPPTIPSPARRSIPLLSLGIPSSNSAAVLLGGFLMHGLIPGPDAVRAEHRSRQRPVRGPARREHRHGRPRLPDHGARASGW